MAHMKTARAALLVAAVFLHLAIAGCGVAEDSAKGSRGGSKGYDVLAFAETDAGKAMLASTDASQEDAAPAAVKEDGTDSAAEDTPAPAEEVSAPADESHYSHALLNGVLGTYVDDRGMVDYAGLKASRGPLDDYVNNLGAVALDDYRTWPEGEQLAFWINAYNAITLRYILDNYPIEKGGFIAGLRFPKNSIRQIAGVWDKKVTKVMGESMTLDNIEHDVLRKKFKEPRIHVALVCASVGCPALRNEAYTGGRIDEQLDDQATRFLSDREKFFVDHDANTVFFSPIFSWYGDDFVGTYADAAIVRHDKPEGAWLAFAARYLSESDGAFLRGGDYKLSELDYDWSLNEQTH